MERRKLALITVLIIIAEIYLHSYWGFCDLVLMQESDRFEYIAQPNQQRFRFRKHILYNECSMRSRSLQSSDSVRILGFGGSTLNGGMATGHDSLATTIIECALDRQYPNRNIRCLNISCENWTPDNCFAYMEEFGDFDADMLFLVVTGSDAYNSMEFRKNTGVRNDYPTKQSLSAIYEAAGYLVSRIFTGKHKEHNLLTKDQTLFNSGFLSFLCYTRERNIPLLVYLHPDRQEIINNKYNCGGDEIIRFCRDNDLTLIDGLKHENISLLRDEIMFNDHGQRVLANILLKEIKRMSMLEK
jgi:hypothetical protein